MKENSFWEWLVGEFSKEGYEEAHIQGIYDGKDSLFVLEKFRTDASKYVEHVSNKQHIYPGYLRVYMSDGGLFEYGWMEEYDGERVYERSIRYIPPFKKVYSSKGYSKNPLPLVYVFPNADIPD